MKTKITIWECSKRFEFLVEFRNLIVKYFNDQDQETICDLRSEINFRKAQAHRYIRESGTPTIMKQYPAPMFGGFVKNIDIIMNVFALEENPTAPHIVVDTVEQAIGVYEAERIPSLKRTFNPFFWMLAGLKAIGRIPFSILESIGLNGKKLEVTFAGKVIKVFTGTVGSIVTAYPILKTIGIDLFTLWERFYTP